ncbi:MAG: PQQ-like beta-propeller repeat protein [Planctomycetes bacterium]|nr:PQQ-like beta-propeller repeat protein [Planctomycetota bacterium]
MERSRRVEVAVVGCIILLGAGLIFAQDWPQWRGPDRDGKVSGFTAPATWPKSLAPKWKTTVGTGDATPALVGDKLYVFARQKDEEVILCLNAGTGKEVWKNKYAAQAVTRAAARHPGPRSSPAVAQGRIVTLGVGGVLSCFDAASGKDVWRRDEFPKTVPMFFTAMSPIIADGMAIAHLGGRGKGAVIAFDLATGEPKWRCDGDGPAYASPVIMTAGGVKQIVTLSEKSVLGIGLADGKLLWQIPAVPQRRTYNSASPIIDGQMVIYTGQGAGTKAVKIEKQGDGFAAEDVWSNDQVGTGFNTPVLKDGLLFGFSDRGSHFCLSAKDGKTMWVDSATQRQNFCSIVDAGSVLFSLPSDGTLIVLKPDGKGYQEVARIKVAETPTYAHPVIAGKRIFVKDDDAVTLYAIE